MLRPSLWSQNTLPGRRQWLGFTLIELMMVIAIIGILASLAVTAYRLYVLKAEATQVLVDYGHIRTVIAVKTYADAETNLELDSTPGAVPPALKGSLDTREFNGPDGMVFQLIRAPAGTFASYPNTDTYALVATGNNAAAVLRLRVIRAVLPQGDGDKVWIQSSADAPSAQLIYPIDIGAVGNSAAGEVANNGGSGSSPSTNASAGSGSNASNETASPGGESAGNSSGGNGQTTGTSPNPTAPGTGNSSITGNGTMNGNTWTASAHICIGSASGGPLTGQTNTAVIFQVVTQYANFQVTQMIDPTTGCTDYSYGGLPLSSNAQVSVSQVVDYNPPNSGGPSALWDGAKPALTIKP